MLGYSTKESAVFYRVIYTGTRRCNHLPIYRKIVLYIITRASAYNNVYEHNWQYVSLINKLKNETIAIKESQNLCFQVILTSVFFPNIVRNV